MFAMLVMILMYAYVLYGMQRKVEEASDLYAENQGKQRKEIKVSCPNG